MTESVSESENPVIPAPEPKGHRPRTNQDWWPNQLDLSVLHQHTPVSNPMDADFDYAEAFKTLDLDALKRDVSEVMTTSQDWWPADYGHYGPLFIRMTWHAGRHLPHRRRPGRRRQRRPALRPPQQLARQRQPRQGPPAALAGQAEVRPAGSPGPISWSSPATAPWSRWGSRRSASASGGRTSGSPTRSSGARRTPGSGMSATAATGSSAGPFGAVQMGLIYVNPEGPNGNPDPLAAARDIRETFRRMAMNDEETVALIAGGHTFGKCHGAGDPDLVGPEPEGCPVEHQGLGWKNAFGTRQGRRHHHQRARGCVDQRAHQVGQRVLRQPVRLRLRADDEPRRCQAVDTHESRGPGHRARRPRPVEAARPDDADDRPGAEARPDLRADLEAVPREPRPSSPTRSPRPGTSCCTATWGPSPATSARGSRSRSCGRTPSPRSTTS